MMSKRICYYRYNIYCIHGCNIKVFTTSEKGGRSVCIIPVFNKGTEVDKEKNTANRFFQRINVYLISLFPSLFKIYVWDIHYLFSLSNSLSLHKILFHYLVYCITYNRPLFKIFSNIIHKLTMLLNSCNFLIFMYFFLFVLFVHCYRNRSYYVTWCKWLITCIYCYTCTRNLAFAHLHFLTINKNIYVYRHTYIHVAYIYVLNNYGIQINDNKNTGTMVYNKSKRIIKSCSRCHYHWFPRVHHAQIIKIKRRW